MPETLRAYTTTISNAFETYAPYNVLACGVVKFPTAHTHHHHPPYRRARHARSRLRLGGDARARARTLQIVIRYRSAYRIHMYRHCHTAGVFSERNTHTHTKKTARRGKLLLTVNCCLKNTACASITTHALWRRHGRGRGRAPTDKGGRKW